MEKTLNTLIHEKDMNFRIIDDYMLSKENLISHSLEMITENMGDYYRVFTESGIYIADIVFMDDNSTDSK